VARPAAPRRPKSRDERCVPQAWDEFHAPCTFPNIPLSAADVVSPMCEVELVGGRFSDAPTGGAAPRAEPRWSRATSIRSDNGLCPSWNETFRVAVLHPQHAFLKVSVYNCRKQLIGKGSRQLLCQAMLPVAALRGGYRNFALKSPHGCPIQECALLAHLEFAPLPRTRASVRGSISVRGGMCASRLSSVGEDAAAAAAWACLNLKPISLAAFTADAREARGAPPRPGHQSPTRKEGAAKGTAREPMAEP
jgi:hypothetical protein